MGIPILGHDDLADSAVVFALAVWTNIMLLEQKSGQWTFRWHIPIASRCAFQRLQVLIAKFLLIEKFALTCHTAL